MVNQMVTWLNENGRTVDPTDAEGVIWAIDRFYPGGFSAFVRAYMTRRLSWV
jgi:hypothetical protein